MRSCCNLSNRCANILSATTRIGPWLTILPAASAFLGRLSLFDIVLGCSRILFFLRKTKQEGATDRAYLDNYFQLLQPRWRFSQHFVLSFLTYLSQNWIGHFSGPSNQHYTYHASVPIKAPIHSSCSFWIGSSLRVVGISHGEKSFLS